MIRYVLKRVGIALLTVFTLATVTFFLSKLLPGDPFMNEKIPVAVQEKQRAYYGLDRPVAEQFFIYMGNLLKGDLGVSIKFVGRSVWDIIREFFPVSAKLGLIALVFAEFTGILFGILCAQFRNRWPDYVLMVFAILGIALPSMVVGPLIRYLFGVQLRWLPVGGWGSWTQVLMPAFVLAVITQDYIKTARAKGMHPLRVVLKHELKNSLVPMLANLGPMIAGVLMGSFVVEQIFVIPGLGKHFVNAVSTLDYPLIMGLTIFYGSFLVVMNLLVDILYGIVDPRIRVK